MKLWQGWAGVLGGLMGGFLVYGQDPNAPPGPFVSNYVAHGEVVIEGVGPAARALVTSSCGGQAEADSQGRFSLAGKTSAAQPCTFSIYMQDCEGYSVTIAAPAGPVALGMVVLKPLRKPGPGSAVSVRALAVPPAAAKLKNEAIKNLRKGKHKEAERNLRKAISLYEKDAEAHYLLGLSYKEGKQYEQAHEAFEKAASLDGKYAPPLVELAVLALRAQDWPDVDRHASSAVAVNGKDYPEAWLYLATARLMQGDAVSAELSARNAIEIAGARDLPKAHHILGLALAKQHRIEEAIAEIERYLAAAPKAADAEAVRRQLQMLQSGAVQ